MPCYQPVGLLAPSFGRHSRSGRGHSPYAMTTRPYVAHLMPTAFSSAASSTGTNTPSSSQHQHQHQPQPSMPPSPLSSPLPPPPTPSSPSSTSSSSSSSSSTTTSPLILGAFPPRDELIQDIVRRDDDQNTDADGGNTLFQHFPLLALSEATAHNILPGHCNASQSCFGDIDSVQDLSQQHRFQADYHHYPLLQPIFQSPQHSHQEHYGPYHNLSDLPMMDCDRQITLFDRTPKQATNSTGPVAAGVPPHMSTNIFGPGSLSPFKTTEMPAALAMVNYLRIDRQHHFAGHQQHDDNDNNMFTAPSTMEDSAIGQVDTEMVRSASNVSIISTISNASSTSTSTSTTGTSNGQDSSMVSAPSTKKK